MAELKMTAEEVSGFLADVFPQLAGRFEIVELAPMRARVRMRMQEADLRPGGTVSGPSMFALADVAFYIVTLAMIGPQALTVTTNCNINFMRKPAPGAMLGEARLMKLGRSLSVGDVTLTSEGSADVVAHAALTYAIPPQKAGAGG
ncbi:PaaI family thioesterase [Oceanomicrobium pacificus]|uniref:Hotdog fold thioesterase n=1 Tax=Oceanomicrobium pacificus TaxID=2692916 RepID=A0A6B0TZ34_9RHOB|nr:PaaI family thioesterase [Oceanomicrobium pacificus]MXU66284.1 hotdog fold thioesterase [Oceanomicrobium pacificus]